MDLKAITPPPLFNQPIVNLETPRVSQDGRGQRVQCGVVVIDRLHDGEIAMDAPCYSSGW